MLLAACAKNENSLIVLQVLGQLKKNGLSATLFDTLHYNHLIKAFCSQLNILPTLEVVQQMIMTNIPFDSFTVHPLIAAASKLQDVSFIDQFKICFLELFYILFI
jgi:predicted oxidoreductase (fatty acid repression mutant protein)